MTTLNPYNLNFSPIGGAQAALEIPAGLSADTILAMVSTNYSNLTQQFNRQMAEEQARGAKLQKLQSVEGLVSARTNQPPQPGSDEAKALADKLEDLKEFAANPDELDIIQKKIDYLKDGSKSPMGENDVKDFNDFVHSKEEQLNGDSQMNLLKIQDLVSKIQSLMSQGSNEVSTLHDMQKGIIGNIRS